MSNLIAEITETFTATNARRNSRNDWAISPELVAVFEKLTETNSEFKLWEKHGKRRIYINDSEKFKNRNITVAVVDLDNGTINLREGGYVSWLAELLIEAAPADEPETIEEMIADSNLDAIEEILESADWIITAMTNGEIFVANTQDDICDYSLIEMPGGGWQARATDSWNATDYSEYHEEYAEALIGFADELRGRAY